MEDIYEALLLIQDSPNRGTKALNQLAHQHPRFLQLLKNMALQLKDRFNPRDEQTYAQFDKVSKQILVIFNRYVKLAFNQPGNRVYLQIQELYHWIMEILTCQKLQSIHKKALEPALSEILGAVCFKTQNFLSFLDEVAGSHMQASPSVFIYLNSLLTSSIYPSLKLSCIQQSYKLLYHFALLNLSKLTKYYRDSYMDLDSSCSKPNSYFLTILKQNEYILMTICSSISYLYNLLAKQKEKFNHQSLMPNLLLDHDLALYLSRVLRIQHEMFEVEKREENPFDLKIIIASNLTSQEKKTINKIKCMCLGTIKLILTMTDKDFNLLHTDKALLKELPVIGELIIQQLIICSYQNVIPTLGEELSIISIISSLFELLAEIVLFRDMKPTFHKLSVDQIVRLSIAFMKTYHEEKEIFENEVEDYYVLVYYILYGRMEEEEEEDSIDLTLGQFCMKKNVVQLIKNMTLAIEGYSSMLMELCCDAILLETQLRSTKTEELRQMFLEKHKLKYSTLQCIDLESSLFTFTVCLEHYSNDFQKKKTIRFLLDNVNLAHLSPLQLCRFYLCLAVHCLQFSDNDIHCKYYHVIEQALSLVTTENSESRHAFYFLQQLTTAGRGMFQSRHYCIFVDKILNDSLRSIQNSQSVYLFDFLIHSIASVQVQAYILSLAWINECLDRLNLVIRKEFIKKNILHELLTSIFILYDKLLKAGKKIIDKNGQLSYPSFRKEESQFNELFNLALTEQQFQIFFALLKDKELIQEQYQLLFKFSDFLFDLLVSDIRLTESSSSLLTLYSVHLLSRQEELDLDYNNTSFKLLYQTINKTPYTLNQTHYQAILTWMRSAIQKQAIDEIHLNRVCIILQQFYYFIKNNVFNGPQMIRFFEPITFAIQKKFLKYLLDYSEYLKIIQSQADPQIRTINLKNLDFNPLGQQKKKNAVTIIRLYNTILMNPNFEPKSLHLIKDIIKFYVQENIPAYDLSVQFLALGGIVRKSHNSGAVQCFRLGLDLLYYNARHPTVDKIQDLAQKEIRNLTKELKSPIAAIDPYQQLYDLVSNEIAKDRDNAVFLDFSNNLQDLEVSVIDFIKSDPYTLDLVKKLTSIRRVNDQPRIIRKIKRQDN